MKTNLELDCSEFWLHHLQAVRTPSYVSSLPQLPRTENKNNNSTIWEGFVKSKWRKYKFLQQRLAHTKVYLIQESQHFWKGSNSKHLRHSGHRVSYNYSNFTLQGETSHTQYINKWAQLSFSKTLQKFKDHKIFTYHKILLWTFFFFQPTNHVKSILSSWTGCRKTGRATSSPSL